MITIRHSLPPEILSEVIPRIYAAFQRAGLDFDSLDVRFDFTPNGLAEEALSDLNLEMLRVGNAFDDAGKALLALPLLKQTAWERRNANAPWYRHFHSKRRR